MSAVLHPLVWLAAIKVARKRDQAKACSEGCLSAGDLTAYVLHLASKRQLKSGTREAIRIFEHVVVCSKCKEAGERIELRYFPGSAPKLPQPATTTPVRKGVVRSRR